MQGRDEGMEGERGKTGRQTDGQTDRQAGRRSVEKELWQERTRPGRRRPVRTEEEEVGEIR